MVVSGLVLWSGLQAFMHTTITLLAALADPSSQTGSVFWDWLIFGRGSVLVASLTGTLFALTAFLKLRTVERKVNTVQEQTNGNVSYRDNRIATLEEELASHGIPIPGNETREGNSHERDS